MLRITSESMSDIPVSEMMDGQLATITTPAEVCGMVVQRFGNAIVPLGCSINFAWENVNAGRLTFRVRILPPGTKLEVV